MSKIGSLEEVQNNGEKEYWGEIKTLTLNLKLRLTPNKEFGSSPNAPDYFILCKSPHGEVPVGNAWLKQLNNPTSDAREFLSITLDDHSFGQSLNVAAFPSGKGKWDIMWRRRQSNAQSEAA